MTTRGSKTARTAAYVGEQWESLEFWAHTVAHPEVYEARARALGVPRDRDLELIHGCYQIGYAAKRIARAGIQEPELRELQLVSGRFAKRRTLDAKTRREAMNFGANVLVYARAHRLRQNPAARPRAKLTPAQRERKRVAQLSVALARQEYMARKDRRALRQNPDEHELADLGDYTTADLVRSVRAGGITANAFRAEMKRRGLAARATKELARLRGNPAALDRARLAYRVTHWGHGGRGKGKRLAFADPTGPLAEVGELMFAGYRTTKLGDGSRPNIYVHDFGPKDRPRLAFNVESKRLLIGGGKARMLTRGITG